MSKIELPLKEFGTADTVSKLLGLIATWHSQNSVPKQGYHSRAWYRGHSKLSYRLEPGVYRPEFTNLAATCYGSNPEEKRLNLEREMLMEFRTAGATFFDPEGIEALYFIAQHYGMPTRLLDWTANPLAALFFTVKSDGGDGAVIVMEPAKLIPPRPSNAPSDFPRAVLTMRHPYASYAISVSFWKPEDKRKPPIILPIRPDNQLGRIGQQSSCFTLHMHNSMSTSNSTLAWFRIPGPSKPKLREELRKLNINQFAIYNDLDHLSEDIRMAWGLPKTK